MTTTSFSRLLGTKAYLLGALTFTSLFFGSTYYGIEVFDHLFESTESEQPVVPELIREPIESEVWLNQPWTSRHWNGTSHLTKLEVDSTEFPFVRITGLHNGSVGFSIDSTDATGNYLIGTARCLEHGGVISNAAVLKRNAENRLEFFADPVDPGLPMIYEAFRSKDITEGTSSQGSN